jgi:glycine/D-amino acid oxidase-like deaminating enzyme
MNNETISSGETSTFWIKNKQPHFQQLNRSCETQVCIIGGGISGLTIAYQLAFEGKKVILIEDGQLLSGETGRTSAHLSNALDDYFFNIIKFHGKEKAQLAAESHRAAIDHIEKIIHQYQINCDFSRVDGYLLATDEASKKQLSYEYDAARSIGLNHIEKLTSCPIASLETQNCLRFPDQAQFHPAKYLLALSKIIQDFGGEIYTNTRVTDIRTNKEFAVVKANSYTITAEKVVIATNAPLVKSLNIHMKQIPNRTYILGAVVKKDTVPPALYWDMAEPYHYVRVQQNYTNAEDLLIIGGEDHRVGEIPGYSPWEKLEIWARRYFPDIQRIDYRWSGQILEPIDYLAYIGRHPKLQNAYLVTGDSGHGLTHGTIAGLLISDLIMKRQNPWEKLYDPKRHSWKAIFQFIKHNLIALKGYTRYLLGKTHKSSPKKASHTLSLVCPHMKGKLIWNPHEKSWDCIVHGSRFSEDGELLNGPAMCPMKKISR